MHRTIIVLSAVLVLLGGAVAPPVAGSSGVEEIDEPAVHVELTAEGAANVSLVSVYDLTDADERDAFETFRGDEATQAELLDRFTDRLDSVASDANNSDREMSVTEESTEVRSDGDRGIVVLTVAWDGLAAVDDDTLVLSEPFASGFETDRTLVVTAPEGSTIESTTPEPTVEDETRTAWDGGVDLSGFEMTVSLASDGGSETGAENESDAAATDELPGFGMPVAVIAIAVTLGVTLLTAGRRDR